MGAAHIKRHWRVNALRKPWSILSGAAWPVLT